jgi:hypothetical protein
MEPGNVLVRTAHRLVVSFTEHSDVLALAARLQLVRNFTELGNVRAAEVAQLPVQSFMERFGATGLMELQLVQNFTAL